MEEFHGHLYEVPLLCHVDCGGPRGSCRILLPATACVLASRTEYAHVCSLASWRMSQTLEAVSIAILFL